MPKLYAGLTILEILGIAVKKEIEAAEFYDGLASRIANPIIKDRFLQLAKDERKHHALLPKADPVSRAEFNVQSATIEEALLYAIQTERAAQKLYGVAAKASTDPRGQQMLEYLVEFEKAHEHQLKTELEFYRKSPLWFDETEDFIHVGP